MLCNLHFISMCSTELAAQKKLSGRLVKVGLYFTIYYEMYKASFSALYKMALIEIFDSDYFSNFFYLVQHCYRIYLYGVFFELKGKFVEEEGRRKRDDFKFG